MAQRSSTEEFKESRSESRSKVGVFEENVTKPTFDLLSELLSEFPENLLLTYLRMTFSFPQFWGSWEAKQITRLALPC